MKAYLLLISAMLATGCTASDDALYPSLSPRPIEKIVAAEPTPAARPAVPADPAVIQRIAEARTALAAAVQAQADAIAAATKATPGAERGSEAWVDNQSTLSRLDSAQAALRNVETDVGAILSDLAQARAAGADTEAAETQATALLSEAGQLVAKGQAEIDARR